QIDGDVAAPPGAQLRPPEARAAEERTTDLVRPGDLQPLVEQEAHEHLRQDHDQHGAERDEADGAPDPPQERCAGLGAHAGARCDVTSRPQPGRPSSAPSRITTRPRTIVQTGWPFVRNPSNGVILLFDWKRSARIVAS